MTTTRKEIPKVLSEDIEITPLYTWSAGILLSFVIGLLGGLLSMAFLDPKFWDYCPWIGLVCGVAFFGFLYKNSLDEEDEIKPGHVAAVNILGDLPDENKYAIFQNWVFSAGRHLILPGIFDFDEQIRITPTVLPPILVTGYSRGEENNKNGPRMKVSIHPQLFVYNSPVYSMFEDDTAEERIRAFIEEQARIYLQGKTSLELTHSSLDLRDQIINAIDERLEGDGPKDAKTGLAFSELTTSMIDYEDSKISEGIADVIKARLKAETDKEQARGTYSNIQIFRYGTDDSKIISQIEKANKRRDYSLGRIVELTDKEITGVMLADDKDNQNLSYVVIETRGDKPGDFALGNITKSAMEDISRKKSKGKK